MLKTRKRNLVIFLGLAILALGILVAAILISLSQTPDVPVAEADRNDGKCVIGWANSHAGITSTAVTGYLPYATVNNAKPDGSELRVFDLNNGNPVTTDALKDVDILFITDSGDNRARTNYVTPNAAQLAVINAEYNTGLRVVTVSDNGGSAPNAGIQFAAMMSMPVVNNLAAGTITYKDAREYVAEGNGLTNSTTYPFLSGLPWNTRGSGLWSPGSVTLTAPATCIQQATHNPASLGTTCLLSYLPAAGSKGMLIVEGNAGNMARPLVTSGALWEEIPDCDSTPEPLPQCGDGTVDAGEQCDNGANNGVACTANYGATCEYCTAECTLTTVTGPYCGDGIRNGSEECDQQDVPEGGICTEVCQLIDPYTVEKASSIQSINSSEAVVRYSIIVTNPNPSELPSRVVDQLPAFVTAADVTNISNSGVFDDAANTITWSNLLLPANNQLTLTYDLRVTAANYGNVNNIVVVYDPNDEEDDRDEEEVTIEADAKITVNKSHTSTTNANGATVALYTIQVINLSDIALVGIRAQDTLGAGIQESWVTAISNGGTIAGRVITWNALSIDPGATVTLTYTVTFPAGTAGTFPNVVIVYDNTGEEIDRDDDTITITPPGTPPVTPPPGTPPGTPPLPETGLFDEGISPFILGGMVLILAGAVAYRYNLGTQFSSDLIEGVMDNFRPYDEMTKAERKLERQAKRNQRRVKKN